jgi:hypothetical protein
VCGGATSQQTQIEATQQAFLSQLTQEYGTVFGESQGILQSLTKTFEPILAAGPNQQGFSKPELTALETQAKQGTGQNYAQAATALGEQEAAAGGGNTFLPSGAKSQLSEELANSAAGNLSNEQLGITEANYATGRANFDTAASELGGVAQELNPVGAAGVANQSSEAAANTANQIASQNNSWMGAVGGLLGGVQGSTSSGASFGL